MDSNNARTVKKKKGVFQAKAALQATHHDHGMFLGTGGPTATYSLQNSREPGSLQTLRASPSASRAGNSPSTQFSGFPLLSSAAYLVLIAEKTQRL